MAQLNGSGKNGKATLATAATTATTKNTSQNEQPTDKSVLIEEVIDEHKQDILNGLHKVIC